MDLDGEIWRAIDPINSHPDELFFVSNFGRLKSHKTKGKSPKIIKGSFLGKFNIIVVKQKVGSPKSYFVHKLVAEYFVEGKTIEKCLLIHLDYDNKNNRFDNLSWATKEESLAHRANIKNFISLKPTNAKLTEDQVVKIKRLLRVKVLQSRIAKEFGVSETQVSRIKRGLNWANVKS